MTAADWLRDLVARHDGVTIKGACDYCDSDTTLEHVAPGIASLVIRHDPECPAPAFYEAARR